MTRGRSVVLVSIITGISCIAFIILGFWQLDRADQKRQLIKLIQTRSHLPPLDIHGQPLSSDEIIHRRLQVRGTFISDRTVLVENRKHNGMSGFHVITPLQLPGSDLQLLVNRGWTQGPHTATTRWSDPDVAEQLITGEGKVPEPPYLELAPGPTNQDHPQSWPYISIQRFEDWSGLSLYPFMLIQDNPTRFIKAWSVKPPGNDSMHTGYAIQWFSFALIAAVLWLRMIMQFRRGRIATEKENIDGND